MFTPEKSERKGVILSELKLTTKLGLFYSVKAFLWLVKNNYKEIKFPRKKSASEHVRLKWKFEKSS